MRILTLNLRAGGNATTIPAIVRRVAHRDAEVVVFSEYRDTKAGALVRAELERIGLNHQAFTPAARGNGVLIAAAAPFVAWPNPFGVSDEEYPNAVLLARFERLQIYGVYLPGQDRKRPHLRCLIAAAKRHNEAGDAAICIGDLNSGRNQTDIEINVRSGRLRDKFSTADLYRELEQEWTEAWAHLHPEEYEFSWYPFRRDPDYRSYAGWRIDKAFLSPAVLPRLKTAEYDHVFREDRLSDHSALLVDLAEDGS
ncbi:MAG TPA: endonuclease/exonuclease/phosphatase family protein [Candidatus Nitrosotalea sp.]|nr:endonuclease/exonuclease/phosphatase family protein [Candidatus Nitrosotalea sp.]